MAVTISGALVGFTETVYDTSCTVRTIIDSDASIAGDLADDKFALFVAGEPHMPTLEFPGDGAQPVKKICFKLLADAYWEE